MEISVDNQIINYVKIGDEDYISITDMLKSKVKLVYIIDFLYILPYNSLHQMRGRI